MYRTRTVSLFVLLMVMMAGIAFLNPSVSRGNMQVPQIPPNGPKPNGPPGQFPTTGNTSTANVMPVNTTLSVFTVNGGGTTVTKTSGEFGATLAASATVSQEFALRWTRTKPGKAEKGRLYIVSNSRAWVGVQDVTMPAESTSLDIQFVMPNVVPNKYELIVHGETGNSTRVTINYTGKGSGGSVAIKPGPTGGPIRSPKGKITGAKFTPVVGSPNEPGYKTAKLSLTLEAESDWQIKEIAVEVSSEPFLNSEIVTASNSKNAPIKLFSGTWKNPSGTTFSIQPGMPKVITIQLQRTSKGQVNAQEAGPGIYSPADWNIAFAQTTTAKFRWSVDGTPFGSVGSVGQSPKKQWLWP